jgi:hypothetical protein
MHVNSLGIDEVSSADCKFGLASRGVAVHINPFFVQANFETIFSLHRARVETGRFQAMGNMG